MRARKIQIKLYADDPGAFELEPFVPVLHHWIKDKALDDLLLDVADYAHVKNGPGLLLVGHASDYYLDLGEGRPGLLYSRKREAPEDPKERVLDAIRRALAACKKLEDAADLPRPPKFLGNEIVFRINDRLRGPNNHATYAEVEPVLRSALDQVYGGTAFSMEREGTERELFTVRVKAPGAPLARELLPRIS